MKSIIPFSFVFTILSVTLFSSCDKEEAFTKIYRDFNVTIENVSSTSTLQTGALPDRTAPIGNGVWAVLTDGNLFDEGQPADEGTTILAEDCFTHVKAKSLKSEDHVKISGEFAANGGPDDGPAIFAGETARFMIRAEPGDKLQIQSMFVQSNDWFYSFANGGLLLFEGDQPISGDVTSYLVLYDAGTEADEMPGIGVYQKLDQDPLATNIGPDDPVKGIREATGKHPTLVIPPVEAVVRITISAQN